MTDENRLEGGITGIDIEKALEGISDQAEREEKAQRLRHLNNMLQQLLEDGMTFEEFERRTSAILNSLEGNYHE